MLENILRPVAKFIVLLALSPALLAAIIKCVVEFETPGFGAEKKQAVLDVIGIIFDTFERTVVDTPLTRDEVVTVAGKIVDVVVAFYNLTGKLKSAPSVPAPPSVPVAPVPSETPAPDAPAPSPATEAAATEAPDQTTNQGAPQ